MATALQATSRLTALLPEFHRQTCKPSLLVVRGRNLLALRPCTSCALERAVAVRVVPGLPQGVIALAALVVVVELLLKGLSTRSM